MPAPRRPRGGDPVLRAFHPIVHRWFAETLGDPSPPQRQGWPAIAAGGHTLILAPTGTGKTLTAFLWELNALIERGMEAPLPNAVQILYVSPLKALNNDIQRNLEGPLAQLRQRFADAGLRFPEIRVAVRTGDTPARERARMVRRAPHVLITTPESLHILLTTLKGRGMFTGVRAVILDEIHAVAGTKRGAHLALTLERLEALALAPPQRIGLSATQRPLDEVARFLGGMQSAPDAAGGAARADPPAADAPLVPRPVSIVDCGLVKKMEIAVAAPAGDFGDHEGSIWPALLQRVARCIRDARTTLVFVNNRGLAERTAARLNADVGEELALPYHGSLSRERRQLLEQRLKAGELRALVTTSSLELGIDIGSVDLVLQLQSPKRVAAGLQRVGRAGHNLAATSRGLFFPTHLEDALEMVAIVGAMREGDVEPTVVVQNALDVLAQVIVAAVSVDELTSAELYALVRHAYPYHRLTRAAFDEVLAMLAGKYPADVAAELAQRIAWDRATDRLLGTRAARLTAVISGGTIPDRGLYPVYLPDRTRLGELDEEFVHESRVGDAFQLGSSTWRFQAIEHDRVIVTPAPGAPARMPFWHGEYMARAPHLASRVGALRTQLAALDDASETDVDALAAQLHADPLLVRAMARWMREERAATGMVPTDRELVLETFRDETGAVRVVLHSPFGARVNAPWGIALAHRARERLRGVEVQVQTTDDGIMLRLPDLGTDAPLDAFLDLYPAEAEQRVLDEVGGTSLFGARFRMNAARALLLPRGAPNRRMPLWLQRLKALDLLQTVRAFPSFPILVETYRDVLQDAFDMPALATVLDDVARGAVRITPVALERASPFTASLQFGFKMDWLYVDDTPRGDRGAGELALDRALLDDLLGTDGLDEATLAALAHVVAQRNGTAPGRRARTGDELAILLDRAGDLREEEVRARIATFEEGVIRDPMHELLDSGRAVIVDLPTAHGPEPRWLLVENFGRYLAAFGAEALASVRTGVGRAPRPAADVVPAPLRLAALTRGAACREILARHLALAGPASLAELRARYDVPERWLAERLDEGQRAGRYVRGRFAGPQDAVRWCSRRLLDLARRRALAQARRDVDAVDLEVFVAFLQRWQHLDPRDRLEGPDATGTIVHQMLGLARGADAWERDILPLRLREYQPAALSALTQRGEIVWVGGGARDAETGVRPLASVRFIARGEGQRWLASEVDEPLSDEASRALGALRAHGASFFADLAVATGLKELALRDALRELAAAGLVTNDAAEALREVVAHRPAVRPGRRDDPDPTHWLPAGFEPSQRPVVQRRSGRRLPRWRRPDLPDARGRGWSGRWALVRTPGTLGIDEPEEVRAEAIARQWLARYGVVTRDWWRRERPPVSWRAIYRELKRLEYRGDVRRGYFVRGLAGAQFALPSALPALRQAAQDAEPAAVVMASGDPANAWALPLDAVSRSALERPRGPGAYLVTRGGRALVAAEGRGARLRLDPDAPDDALVAAVQALAEHLLLSPSPVVRRRREWRVETVDGEPAAAHARAAVLAAAGLRRDGRAMRMLAPIP